ncbi:MAG: hypothetical protein FWF94_06210 [Oscillospiraceae bacterium]|nr:hypothetical protein [Oscillospiraceae bacterium]
MTFKESVKKDIHRVFLNVDEHADLSDVQYNGKDYHIPVVIDRDGARERGRLSNDNNGGQKIQGIYISDMVVYISFDDLGIVPRKDTRITIDGDEYSVVKSAVDAGIITLDLEEYDE